MSVSSRGFHDPVRRYLRRRNMTFRDQLGAGIEGSVYATDSQTAVKLHSHRGAYDREKVVYLRLRDRGVESVRGFRVPTLIDYDDDAQLIEMDIVIPPFVVDFAQASLTPPLQTFADEDEEDEALREWNEAGRDIFGRHWETVQSILSGFRVHGVYLADLHPRNIDFGDGWQYEDD